MAFDVDTLLTRATDALTAGRSYGPVVERDGATIIPAAWVIGGGGGGSGEGATESGEPTGVGTGGGFFSVSWPVGAYVIKGGEVRWVSAIDGTRIAVGLLGLAGALLKIRAKRRPG